jgi:ABC-2 type transport system permease protein
MSTTAGSALQAQRGGESGIGGPLDGRAGASRSLLGELVLVAWQVRYEQRAFWRNRRRAVASFAFPLMFLLIFGALESSQHLPAAGGRIAYIDFYVPGIIAYTSMVIGFSSMAMVIATLRDKGVIKRMRTTPMPWSSYLAGIVISTVITVIAATIVLLLIGLAFYKAELRTAAIPGFVATIALGTACFTSLGIAISRLIPKPDSGMSILMFVTMPLSFVSQVFFPVDKPKWLVEVGKFFPLRPFAEGLAPTFNAHASGSGFVGSDLRSLAIWTVVGCVLMIRTMRKLSSED